MTISTQIAVETPENIDLYAEPAGIIVRSLAYVIDLLIRGLVMVVCSLVLSFTGYGGRGILLIVWFLVTWFYTVIFEVEFRGQTPGKKKMGIAVVNDDLTPVSWGTSIIRNFMRFADALPFGYCFGVISMVTSTHFRRLGDLAAGTLVIYRSKEKAAVELPAARAHPSPVFLEREDQIAIVGFTQRHKQLSDARQRELANILAPVLPVDEARRVDYLRGIGRWLVGER